MHGTRPDASDGGCDARRPAPAGTPAPSDRRRAGGAGETLAATPACGDAPVTQPQTEGPFFKPRSPQRNALRDAGVAGTRLDLAGRVLTRACRPVAGALLDFWQADASGAYDNTGFRLRGHQFADAEGRFRLATIVPGEYPGRTPHIHVKIQPPGGRILTTQLYFPHMARNARDGLYRPELEMALADDGDGFAGRFTFVLA